METVITHARLVLEDGVVEGTVAFDESGLKAVDAGPSRVPGAIDAEGEFVAPGLIEVHTDNLERHFSPRPKVYWPDALGAALAHDAQMVAAGVTTVYNAVAIGFSRASETTAFRRDLYRAMI